VHREQSGIGFKDNITVKDVSFRYDSLNPLVLNGVNLTIPRGSKIAFVGPSGSGKSTLIDVVMGLFLPVSGHVSIDGIRMDESTRESWQAGVGYVPQTVFLYNDTVARNIAFGVASIDAERLANSCDWAQLGPLIAKLPDGLNTKLGERGVRLSGGERQRIGLARAFYRKPDVLVLDEATSALDGRTEKAVIEAIRTHLPMTTTLMIAHRISTVRHCDKLYVMDRGEILTEGSFSELIETSELFQELTTFS
jgi:ABC-type multidrug transport system fused ATPase/permease subunit